MIQDMERANEVAWVEHLGRRYLVWVEEPNTRPARAFTCAAGLLGRLPTEVLEQLVVVHFRKYTNAPRLICRRAADEWGTPAWDGRRILLSVVPEYIDERIQDSVVAELVIDGCDRERVAIEAIECARSSGIKVFPPSRFVKPRKLDRYRDQEDDES